jgi:tRNA(Ile2) C34 agmatinyltransferase TiaS
MKTSHHHTHEQASHAVEAANAILAQEQSGSVAYLRSITPAQRKCLGCGKMFKSTGSGNRRCPRCQGRMKSGNSLPQGSAFI